MGGCRAAVSARAGAGSGATLSIPSNSKQAGSAEWKSILPSPNHLLGRLYALAAILGVEAVGLASIPHAASLLGPMAPFGIVSFAVFVGLGYSKLKAQREPLPVGWIALALHAICIAAVCAGNYAALHGYEYLILSHAAHLMLRGLMVAAIGLLALACIPWAAWVSTLRMTGRLWLYSGLAGALAWAMRYPMQSFWNDESTAPGHALQVLAFHSVKAVLGSLLPNLNVDAESFTIGTPRFTVIIAEACSGMEGLGLVLVFTVVWLWYFRRESRFPQALLLVPCALVCVWMLNIARIAALVLIGNAGSPEVAMVGFHSQAGWIAFTAVAFGFSMATRKIGWVRRIPTYQPAAGGLPVEVEGGEPPATGAYLTPFLAILAASFVVKAVSGYFEPLYAVRLAAAALALWVYRAEYRRLDWRFGWLAPVVGAAVFALWIAPSLWRGQAVESPIAAGLAALSPGGRWTWIALRVLAAVVTVPLAEELAFRGYLARRLMGREFERLPFRGLNWLSILISSVAFGLMHGRQWMVGVVAGLAFALVLKRSGRMGDAVAAHATSNLLLAAWVLLRGDWSQW